MNRSLNQRVTIAIVLTGLCLVLPPAQAQNRQPATGNESDILPPQILSIAGVSAKLQVAQRCSRSLRLRSNVIRTFVADPRIAEVVQFGPNELALISLGQGSTTVTLWFERDSEPLIILIEGVSAPATYDDSLSGHAGATAVQFVVPIRPRSAPTGNARSPPHYDKSAIPIGARDPGSRPGTRSPAPVVQRARYDGHSLWPATERAALRDGSLRRQYAPSAGPR